MMVLETVLLFWDTLYMPNYWCNTKSLLLRNCSQSETNVEAKLAATV